MVNAEISQVQATEESVDWNEPVYVFGVAL